MKVLKIFLVSIMASMFVFSGLSAQAGAGRRAGEQMHAQQGAMRQGGGGPLRMIPRLQTFAPAALLERAEEIQLTTQQIEDLNDLVKELGEVTEESSALHDEHGQAMRSELMKPEPNIDIVSQHFWAAHGSQGRLHWVQVQSSLAAMKVLTAEQRRGIEGG